MGKKRSNFLFNWIAPVYGLFYHRQKRHYSKIMDHAKDTLNVSDHKTVLDVGCGTGALCSVLFEKGMDVTGVDPAIGMLKNAMRKPNHRGIAFLQADAVEGLPFENKTFDLAIASFVAHGMKSSERLKLYAEMSRVAKHYVIIHDYNQRRTLLTTIIEWLEGGDYFRFIQRAEGEMKDCVSELNACFTEVTVIPVDKGANWYICKPS